MFNQFLYHRTEVPVIEQGEDRFYQTPDGTFPSVTTVLSRLKDNTQLDKWRNKVGNEEADAIRFQANEKGKTLHSLAERYLSNDENWKQGIASVNLSTFRPIQKFLDENVITVYGLELLVWSKKLKIAGRTDALVDWKNGKHIIDFKTSKREVKEDSTKAYFFKLQATIYAMLVEEHYWTSVPYSTILVMQNGLEPLI